MSSATKTGIWWNADDDDDADDDADDDDDADADADDDDDDDGDDIEAIQICTQQNISKSPSVPVMFATLALLLKLLLRMTTIHTTMMIVMMRTQHHFKGDNKCGKMEQPYSGCCPNDSCVQCPWTP